jgi:hypothetical protein
MIAPKSRLSSRAPAPPQATQVVTPEGAQLLDEGGRERRADARVYDEDLVVANA